MLLRRSTLTVAILLGAIAAVSSVSLAEDPFRPICRWLLQEEHGDREELELAVELAASELDAAEQIHRLLDGLWKNDAVERLVYLTSKHARDVARLKHEREVWRLERQDGRVEQLRLLCDDSSPDRLSDEERRAYDRAFARFLKADCEKLAGETSIAETDLEYFREVLRSVLDLREHDVATKQDVIVAERNVALARESLEHGGARVSRCREELAGLEQPPRP